MNDEDRRSRAKSSADASVGRKRKAENAAEGTIKRVASRRAKGNDHPLTENHIPTQRLDVYVVGANGCGELGMGDLTKKTNISKPILNTKLSAENVGVVHITVGGMHSAALTHDNQILTWGINDEGALGRDTSEDENQSTKSGANGVNEDDDEDVMIDLKEGTPLPVDKSHFPDGTVFTQLAATNTAAFAVTKEGLVYGWGTFRGGNGNIGFSSTNQGEQRTPVQIAGLSDVTKLAAGAQHILALTSMGTVFSWGDDEQRQLGRRRRSRLHESHPLAPYQCALRPDVIDIGAGSYHSFAIRRTGAVYAWGSNNFGQTGITASAGQSNAIVPYPSRIRSLRLRGRASVISIVGGKDHSIALTEQSRCLIWGRIDNKALGMGLDDMPQSEIVFDEYGKPRILRSSTMIPEITEEISFATAGTDHSFAVAKEGQIYGWGFNNQHQAGHSGEDDEIERPTMVQSKYLEEKKIISAAAGGQFSIFVGEHV